MQQDRQLLRDFGLKVNNSQMDETLKLINSTQKEQLERIRTAKTENTQQNFLKNLLGAYKNEVDARNNKIVFKDNTYLIRAVDPEDIQSITERAYFNSFNMQRHKATELLETQVQDSEIIYKNPTNVQKQEIKEGEVIIDEKEQCYCGKKLDGINWVQCDNKDNCKGSIWYHFSCVGLTENDSVENQTFICKFCKDSDENPEPQKRKLPKP